MLYHCMNAKRLGMDPTPPMPLLADQYGDNDLPFKKTPIRVLLLQPQEKGASPISAQDFFNKSSEDEEKSESDAALPEGAVEPTQETLDPQKTQETLDPQKKSRARSRAPRIRETISKDSTPFNDEEKELFEMLRQCRKVQAAAQGCSAFIIAYNTALEDMARQRPLNKDDLSLIRGIGPIKIEKYGQDWIDIIVRFKAEKEVQTESPQTPPKKPQTTSSITTSSSRRTVTQTLQQKIPQFHTGISFTMEQITIDTAAPPPSTFTNPFPVSSDNDPDSDSSSAFGSPLQTPTRARSLSHSSLKRKRSSLNTPTQTIIDNELESVRSGKNKVEELVATPQCRQPPPPSPSPLSLSHQIFHNKLLALSKAVTTKLSPPPTVPIVNSITLRLIVARPPRTNQELWAIPDIGPFVRACKLAKCDLLEKITLWRVAEGTEK